MVAQITPFKVLYGRDPPHLIYYEQGSTLVASVKQYLEDGDRILVELKGHLLRAQQIMKRQAYAHRKDIQFEVGDRVYLKLRPYRQRTLAHRRNEKLSPHYLGPYKIVECIGVVTYLLHLPPSSTIHPMFHVSQLLRVVGEDISFFALPPTLTDNMEVLLEPLEVEGVHQEITRNKEVLIRWKNQPKYKATWESN
ncbi:uncharacterized protein LOC110092272 [Dendrobium catenatum]|uniref:uncharacterized protein LOC110092272 n=1 Tax=Dendrobium catenatum TaxID=906689 RepID=UPI0009F714A9|nr:uncharacterized protein LOC110092272 [Dendrobium catenatum]